MLISNSSVSKLFFLVFVLLVSSNSVLANTTAPGVNVTNTLTLTYSTGVGDPVTLLDPPSITFTVDRKIDLLLTTLTSSAVNSVIPGTAQALLSFKLENLGNGDQGYIINITQEGDLPLTASSSATLSPDVNQYWLASSSVNDFDTATAIPHFNVGGTSNNIGDIAAGEEIYIWIIANIPPTELDQRQNSFTLTAITTQAGSNTELSESRSDDLNVENIIFADATSNSSLNNSIVYLANDGKDADQARFLITAPIISAEKSVVVLDEGLPGGSFNCTNVSGTANVNATSPAFIPGACIEYTISVTNSDNANADAENVIIRDELNNNLTFMSVTIISFTGTSAGDATVVAEPTHSNGEILTTIGRLPAGVTASFRIRAIIN